MSYFTYMRLNVTAYEVGEVLALDALLDAMKVHQYDTSDLPGRGWAGMSTADVKGEPTTPPLSPGAPASVTLHGRQCVIARCAFDATNQSLVRAVGSDRFDEYPERDRYALKTVDVIATSFESSTLILVASTQERFLSPFRELTRMTLNTLGSDATFTRSPLLDLDANFFLWLFYKWDQEDGHISDTLQVTELYDLRTVDRNETKYRTWGGDAIDTNLPNLMVAVGDNHNLGPAKLAVFHQAIDLSIDLHLRLASEFSVLRESTEYTDLSLPGAELGVRATLDTSLVVIPELRAAWEAEKDWPIRSVNYRTECRERFRAWA